MVGSIDRRGQQNAVFATLMDLSNRFEGQSVSARLLRSFDRSNNIILFGLPELPLLSMKSAIDAMSTHLIGKVVRVIDLVVNPMTVHRPVLVQSL